MSPFHRVRFERQVDGGSVDVLMIFLADDHLPTDVLSALVDEAVEADLAPDEMVLVVRENGRSAAVEAIGQSPELAGMRERLGPHATVTIIGFGANGAETGRAKACGAGHVSRAPLAELGRRAVTEIFQRRGGFVDANANYHFRNPSGRHTDRFMRLSNLLVRSAEVSMIAMVALPLLPPGTVEVHVDTPAMFSVVAAMSEHIQSLRPGTRPLRQESFRSYLDVDTHDFLTGGPSAVLISASSSGSLAARIAGRGVASESIGHLLYLGNYPEKVRFAVDLAADAKANPGGVTDKRETYEEGKCALCEDGSLPVPLVGDQFDLGGPDFEPLTVNKTDAPTGLGATMERLATSGMLTISTRTGSARRQYFVDAARLTTWPAFAERLGYFARRHVPSTVLECVMLDEGSEAFARDLLAAARINPTMLKVADIDGLQRDDVHANGVAKDGSPIVIAAAVIESGRSLRDVSRDLRRARPKSPQVYVVGLAKSPSPTSRQELERTLVQTHEPTQHAFAVVEDLLLPPSGTSNAWAAELAFLDRAAATGMVLGAALEKRRQALNQASRPLVDDLFVANGEQPLALQPGFVFWPQGLSEKINPSASQADVFYTMSSVLQRLRTNSPKRGARALRANWFQQTRLDPANLGRFNDSVIQASLLRAARPTEIDYSTNDSIGLEAGRVIRRIIGASNRPRGEAASEILVALGSRRLRLRSDELEQVLTPDDNHPPRLADLLMACRAVLP